MQFWQQTFPVLDPSSHYIVGYLYSNTRFDLNSLNYLSQGFDSTYQFDLGNGSFLPVGVYWGLSDRNTAFLKVRATQDTNFGTFTFISYKEAKRNLKPIQDYHGIALLMPWVDRLDVAEHDGNYDFNIGDMLPPGYTPGGNGSNPGGTTLPDLGTHVNITTSMTSAQAHEGGYFDIAIQNAFPTVKFDFQVDIEVDIPVPLKTLLKAFVIANELPLPNNQPNYDTIRFVSISDSPIPVGTYIITISVRPTGTTLFTNVIMTSTFT